MQIHRVTKAALACSCLVAASCGLRIPIGGPLSDGCDTAGEACADASSVGVDTGILIVQDAGYDGTFFFDAGVDGGFFFEGGDDNPFVDEAGNCGDCDAWFDAVPWADVWPLDSGPPCEAGAANDAGCL